MLPSRGQGGVGDMEVKLFVDLRMEVEVWGVMSSCGQILPLLCDRVLVQPAVTAVQALCNLHTCLWSCRMGCVGGQLLF